MDDVSKSPTVIDTAIVNANIITIDPQRPRAEALAISGGKFVAVGTTAEIKNLIGPKTRVVSLTGKTVVPGFIDAHLHVLSSGIRHVTAVDCDRREISTIQADLRARARQTPQGQWVQGFKFDNTKTTQNRFLTQEDLDAVSIQHPVFVFHRSGHIYFVNSKALERTGITKETPDSPGGNGDEWLRIGGIKLIADGAIHGAYASFEEQIKGSIEVGKLADLVVLGADPTMVNPHTIKNIPIEQTMVGGKVVYEK